MSQSLANSYGLELGTTEYQKHPLPQSAFDDSTCVPEAVNGNILYGDAHGKFNEHGHYHQIQTKDQPPKEKILRLPKKVFWIILVLLLLLALGIGLGSGLAVGLRQGKNSSPSTQTLAPSSTATSPSNADQTTSPPSSSTTVTPSISSSSTSTISAAVTSGTTGLAANSCNFTIPKTYYTPSGMGFTQYCFTDWPNKATAADGSGNVTYLSYTIVYTFEDCMQECLEYNKGLASGRPRCTAVTYNSNLTSIVAVGKQGGNCFLKDKKAVNEQGSAESACAAIAGRV